MVSGLKKCVIDGCNMRVLARGKHLLCWRHREPRKTQKQRSPRTRGSSNATPRRSLGVPTWWSA